MKDFLIIGNLNAVTYKEVFPLIKAGEVRLGVHANTTMKFASPYENVQGDGNEIAVPAVTWYTTLTHDRINPPLTLTATYTPEAYPHYDNYDAINVNKTKDIPRDYDGVMGVPISFLDKWCTEQFEIVDIAHRGVGENILRTKVYTKSDYPNSSDLNAAPVLKDADANMRIIFSRILIRRRK